MVFNMNKATCDAKDAPFVKFFHAVFAVLIWLVIMLPFLLTIGRLWEPRRVGAWGWLCTYIDAHLPRP